jgi:hypothetical protein
MTFEVIDRPEGLPDADEGRPSQGSGRTTTPRLPGTSIACSADHASDLHDTSTKTSRKLEHRLSTAALRKDHARPPTDG